MTKKRYNKKRYIEGDFSTKVLMQSYYMHYVQFIRRLQSSFPGKRDQVFI